MSMDRRAWIIARFAALLLVLVSFAIVYWQLVRGRALPPVAYNLVEAANAYAEVQGIDPHADGMVELADLPQPVIQRTVDLLRTIQRGSIYDRRGRLLASDQTAPDGTRYRQYNEPALAHTTGYVSGIRTGVSGLEMTYNETLLGLDLASTQLDRVLNRPVTGSDLILTIDSAIQQAADEALRGRAGAIVVLDAPTGAVLASASAPRFDPGRVLDEGYLSELQGSPAPFLNRATQALYTPGSTWKTVALIAGLDSGQIDPSTVFDFGDPIQGPAGPYYVYRVDGGVVPDPNHSERQLDLTMSYAKSANAAFARIGDEMPPDTLIDYAQRFGFGAPGEIDFELDIPYSPAQVATDPDALRHNNLLRAVTAIGQGELLSSPLTMGMVVLSVYNDGDLPVPYYVQAIQQPNGRRSERLPSRQVLRDRMRRATAEQVRAMMVRTVEAGSGRAAQIPGVVVGGKTGTAQVGGDRPPHSWFTGFADDGTHAVVVVVMIENGGEGGATAAPIFAEVARVALNQLSE